MTHLKYLARISYNRAESRSRGDITRLVLLLTQKEKFTEPQESSLLSLKQSLGHGSLNEAESVGNLTLRFLFILSFLKIGAMWTVRLLCDWKRCAKLQLQSQ